MKENNLSLKDALIIGGDAACGNYTKKLEEVLKTARRAHKALLTIEIQDVYDLGMTDKLIRLQRNANALSYLLSIARDVSDCMTGGIYEIVKAINDAKEAEELRKKEALEREEQSRKSREKYKREKLREAADQELLE